MQLPPLKSRWTARITFGRYAARRLRNGGHEAMARSARAVTDAVLAAGRALDDARFATQDALADRDGADDVLDDTAKDLRHDLAGRSRDAAKSEPYVKVYPDGIDAYTAATIDEQETRYGELRARVEAHLPAKDPARKTALAGLDAGLAAWREAQRGVSAARNAEALADTALRSAIDAFDRQMTRTWGTLVASHNKTVADRYFPSTRRASTAAKEPT